MDFSVRQSDGLETVRVLHQTIVSLRAALEQSKNEISQLKSHTNHHHLSTESVESVVQSLSVENYILRRHIAEKQLLNKKLNVNNLIDAKNNISETKNKFIQVNEIESKDNLAEEQADEEKKSNASINRISDDEHNLVEFNQFAIKKHEPKKSKSPSRKVQIVSPTTSSSIHTQTVQKKLRELKISIKAHRNAQQSVNSRSLESLTILKAPLAQKISFQKTLSFSNLSSIKREFNFHSNKDSTYCKIMTDQQKYETPSTAAAAAAATTKVTQSNEEPLISPTQNDLDQEVDDIELIFTTDETKDQDFKEQLVPIDTRESNSNLLNLPLSDTDQISDRELEDDDVFNDDVSDDKQTLPNQSSLEIKRDNSLLNSHSDNSINHDATTNLKSCYSFQDSSFENKSLEKDESFDRFEEKVRIVETDISKCGIQEVEYIGSRRNTCPNPLQYKPLAHRESILKTFKKSRPILTHSSNVRCESEAQTDISALPGSSWKSESSLAHKVKVGENVPTLPSKYPMPGSRLKLSQKTVEARRVLLSDIGFTSMVPELSRSADHLGPASGVVKPPTAPSYGQYLKASDMCSTSCLQKFTWNATTTTPSDSSQTHSRYSGIYPLSPTNSSRRCSVPVSPSKRGILRTTSSKVRFANGSLPELRSDWSTVDSGDSTDSLVDEAENFLRRSIDCIITSKGNAASYSGSNRTVPRRASAPEPSRDNIPPQGWQPFLPRIPRDLKLDNWVKVITPESRVRGGRVRYVGPIASLQDQEIFVGVQLASPEGVCDGIYGGKRYFNCEPCHGIFVPFKKVIMGWKP